MKNKEGEVIKLGVSISTHSSETTHLDRLDIIKKCLDSIPIKSDLYVNIVCDGITEKHKEIIKNYPFDIIYKENKGISQAKNTGIRKIIENGCDIGFLMDDDMIITNSNVFEKYAEAIIKTDIPHFSYYINNQECQANDINGFMIYKSPMVNGCFLTFTKELIKDIGYFKVFPYKYGHEHSNFSIRCLHHKKIPYFCDIVKSDEFLILNKMSYTKKSMSNIDQEKFNKNENYIHKDLDDIVPLIE